MTKPLAHIEVSDINGPENSPNHLILDKIQKIFSEFSRELGTFFEPEQDFDIYQKPDNSTTHYRFDICPKCEPNPIFAPYVKLSIRFFHRILNASFVCAQNDFIPFDSDNAINQLRPFPMLETESNALDSCIQKSIKKVKRLGTSFVFRGVVPDTSEFYELSAENITETSTSDPPKEEIIFENYEFDYEIFTFSLAGYYPSTLLINGQKFDVYFSQKFIDSDQSFIKKTLYENLKTDQHNALVLSLLTEIDRFKLRYLNLTNNIPSKIYFRGVTIKVFFDQDVIKQIHDFLRKRIGAKINLRDFYTVKEKGEVIGRVYYSYGTYKDKKSCFKFIEETDQSFSSEGSASLNHQPENLEGQEE